MKGALLIGMTLLVGYGIGLYIGFDAGVKSDAESCTKIGFFYYHDQVFICEAKR